MANSTLIAELPEHGALIGEEAAALTGSGPCYAGERKTSRKAGIAGGRRALRHVLFQAALVVSHHNPSLKAVADRLRKAGKPHGVIGTAVARMLVIFANVLRKRRQEWKPGRP